MFEQYKTDAIWRKKDIVGIDIGTNSVKVVQLKSASKLTKLVGYGQYQVPDNYIVEGIVTEPEKLAVELNRFLKTDVWGQITAERVVSSLPESKIFTRTITLPQMPEKELAEAVGWEASQTIPVALTDLYLDYQIIGPSETDPKSNEVIYAAAPKAIVNSYIQLFLAMGLEVSGIETSLAAIARAMIPTKDSEEVTMVIDIGGKTTNLAVFDHVIRVTGSTPMGAVALNQKIKEITGQTAENIEGGKKIADKLRVQIREAIDSEVTEITREASRMVSYYAARGTNKKVTKILLSGGGANILNLAEIVEEKLSIKTVVGNPWENISIYPIKPIPRSVAAAYTNAVGLALLGGYND